MKHHLCISKSPTSRWMTILRCWWRCRCRRRRSSPTTSRRRATRESSPTAPRPPTPSRSRKEKTFYGDLKWVLRLARFEPRTVASPFSVGCHRATHLSFRPKVPQKSKLCLSGHISSLTWNWAFFRKVVEALPQAVDMNTNHWKYLMFNTTLLYLLIECSS